MISKASSCALSGLDGIIVTIEADCCSGLPAVEIVGLPDAAVKESKERVRSAINNSDFCFPQKRLVVNLAPAYMKKEGAYFDLPITIAILSASGQLDGSLCEGYIFIGELALDGSIRRVNGVLPMLIEARKKGFKKAVVPAENVREAAVVEGVEVYGAESLTQIIAHLKGSSSLESVSVDLCEIFEKPVSVCGDYGEVKGQDGAKRALVIAAAGGHNVLLLDDLLHPEKSE